MAEHTLTLTAEQVNLVRGCLADRLVEQTKIVSEEVSEAQDGRRVAMEDAAWKVRESAMTVDILEQLGFAGPCA